MGHRAQGDVQKLRNQLLPLLQNHVTFMLQNHHFKKFKYPCVILTDEEEYLYLLESYYQNVQVSGEK